MPYHICRFCQTLLPDTCFEPTAERVPKACKNCKGKTKNRGKEYLKKYYQEVLKSKRAKSLDK